MIPISFIPVIVMQTLERFRGPVQIQLHFNQAVKDTNRCVVVIY